MLSTAMRHALAATLLIASASGLGCSSVGAQAVRTGGVRLPPRAGAIAVYLPGRTLEGGTELGLVEVHAANNEATVDTLLPLFVQKVASLGGNAAVVDSVRARFEIYQRPFIETFVYPCGYWTCTGTRMYATNDEVMTVSMTGRAMLVGPSGAAAADRAMSPPADPASPDNAPESAPAAIDSGDPEDAP
jgi:hypothetical protein